MMTSSTTGMTRTAEQLYADLRTYIEPWRGSATQFVGIASGGAWMVKRLQSDWGLEVVGVISSSMHRDDYLRRGRSTASSKSIATRLETTDLPFDVTGTHIVLLDDVLYTGRTIRAVINELFDYGRPASVRLAVLVDRGGRELPLAADYAAMQTDIGAAHSLRLMRSELGQFTFETT
jgi:pyrimidine operon attenuation protein / uracil phosphoribosyltransferase